MKREVLRGYIDSDLLLISDGDYSSSTIKRLFSHSRKVLEFTMSFINTLSSRSRGRVYLLRSRGLIEVLVKLLHYEKEDSTLR